MTLFKSKSGESRFLLFVGESCPSNCFNCNNRDLGQKYFSYDSLKNNISFFQKNIDKNSEIMLFYTDSVYHPEVLDLVNDNTLKQFRIFTLQTHPIYTDEYGKKVNEIVKVNPNVLFHICNFYLNEKSFKNLKYYTENIVNLDGKFDVDLYFDFIKYKKLLKQYLSIFPWMVNTMYENGKIKSIKLEYKNIEINLYFQGEQIFIEDKKYITNVYYKKCISENSYDLENDSISILEEVAFLQKGDIVFHRNTLCSKAIKSISSIKKSNAEIIDDFKKLKKDLSKYNDGNKMGFNCYTCIKNKINYVI